MTIAIKLAKFCNTNGLSSSNICIRNKKNEDGTNVTREVDGGLEKIKVKYLCYNNWFETERTTICIST